MKKQHQRWYSLFFLFFSFLLLSVASFVFIVDPYQHYRENDYHLCYKNEDYFNSGIAKNYRFDSVISGSSMMQNFRLDNIQSFLDYKNPIKLTIAGGNFSEHHRIMQLAIKNHQIKNILLGIDVFSFKESAKPSNRLPEYLYNDNFLDDYKYLINISNINDSIKILRDKTGNDPRCRLNNMYQWQHTWVNTFGKKKVLDKWKNGEGAFNSNFKASEYTTEKLLANFKIYLLPLVQDNQDINFTLIFPPYSILTFKDIENKNWLDAALTFRLQVIRSLSHYPNVQIYDFQIVKSITHNLNNYKDLSHYHQDINYWMLEQIKKEKYHVDKTNIKSNNIHLRQQIISLDNNTSFWEK